MKLFNLVVSSSFLFTTFGFQIFQKAHAQSGGVTCECRPGLVYVPGRKYSSYENSSCAYRACSGGSTPNVTSSSKVNSLSSTYTTSNPLALSATPAFQVSKGMSVLVKTNGGWLNVRSSAGLNNIVIGNFTNQAKVVLSGLQQEGWVQLESGGWVHSDYLNPL